MFKKTGFSAHIQKAPELSALQQLLAEALQNRGRQVQLVWRPSGAGTFTLVLLCNIRGDPRWCLYREQQGKNELLFDYSSCDVLLVMNLIGTSVAEPQKLVRSPFLTGKRENEPEVFPTVEEIEAVHLAATKTQTQAASTGQAGGQAQAGIASPAAESPAAGGSPASGSSAAGPSATSGLPAAAGLPAISGSAPAATSGLPAAAGSLAPAGGAASDETASSPELDLLPRTIDEAAIQSVMTALRRTDTGMFMFPAFLYFLEQEFFRSLRTRVSLSVIVFDMKETLVLDGKKVMRTLPSAPLVEAVKRISTLKRHVDLLCHYDGGCYAILLPNTRIAGARAFAQRVAASLAQTPLPNVSSEGFSLFLGSASIPEDFVDMGKLLGAAELALAQARAKGAKVVMYSDIKKNVKVPD